jgi:AraC-like DNA-binding protein
MIVTTRFPDLPPGPETADNAGFRERFRAGWGRVDSVFLARAERLELGPLPSALSIKLVLEGAAELRLGRRRLRLEPGRFLLVNPGQDYSLRIDRPTLAFSVHFSPAMASQVAENQGQDWEGALDASSMASGAMPLWREQVRVQDDALAARLAALRSMVHRGASHEALDEASTELLAGLLARDCRERWQATSRLSARRATTRDELARRVGWAVDHIESHYAHPIGLADMAAAAHLSRFHFLRAFRELHGCTPSDYLRARRVQAARRLLADPAHDMDTVLAASGFGSRWSLRRALRAQR